jgi:hypothetical protein
MILKPGQRLQSVVDDTNVVVVKAGSGEVDLRCGGQPMVAVGEKVDRVAATDTEGGGTQMGKRYEDAEQTLELLVTKAGGNPLAVGDTRLELKDAKPLPSSD